MEERIKTAIEFLKQSQSFKICDLRFGFSDQYLYITGWSESTKIENITKSSALIELKKIKAEIKHLTTISSDLNRYLADKEVKINLAFNYGMGSIPICYELHEVIIWELKC